jgi:hypothetical protein
MKILEGSVKEGDRSPWTWKMDKSSSH